jgi:hypothetical protein
MNCLKQEKLGYEFGVTYFTGFVHYRVLKMKHCVLEEGWFPSCG